MIQHGVRTAKNRRRRLKKESHGQGLPALERWLQKPLAACAARARRRVDGKLQIVSFAGPPTSTDTAGQNTLPEEAEQQNYDNLPAHGRHLVTAQARASLKRRDAVERLRMIG